jgi:hypothetical protein
VLAGLIAGRGEKLPGALGVGLVGCMGVEGEGVDVSHLGSVVRIRRFATPRPAQESMLQNDLILVCLMSSGLSNDLKV